MPSSGTKTSKIRRVGKRRRPGGVDDTISRRSSSPVLAYHTPSRGHESEKIVAYDVIIFRITQQICMIKQEIEAIKIAWRAR
jgi:hypothetical protein